MKPLQLNRPHAIMMVGLPGSGKTFFASHFADTFGAPYIDAQALTTLAKDTASATKLITMFVSEVIRTGQTFIFEGDTSSRTLRTEFAQFARANGYQPLIVWVQVDQKTAADRSVKLAKLDKVSFEKSLKTFSAPHPSEKPVVISGKHTYASQVKTVLAHLTRDTTAGSTITRPAATTPERLSVPPRP